MTNKELLEKLRQAENDYDMFVQAGPDAFESEDEYHETVESAYGVVYALVAMLQGRDQEACSAYFF